MTNFSYKGCDFVVLARDDHEGGVGVYMIDRQQNVFTHRLMRVIKDVTPETITPEQAISAIEYWCGEIRIFISYLKATK